MADIQSVLNSVTNFASPNRFYVEIGSMSSMPEDKSVKILTKAVTLPDNTRNEAEYWKNGIKYIIPREIAFSNEITVTFYQDEVLNLRGMFMKSLNANQKKNSDDEFNITLKVVQEKHNSDGDKEFLAVEYSECFIKSVGGIALSSDSVEIPTFDIVFAFNWQKETIRTGTPPSGAVEPSSKGLLAALGF